MSEIILVTRPEFEKGRSEFERVKQPLLHPVSPEESALAEKVQQTGCRAVILGVETYTGPLYRALGETGGPDGAIMARASLRNVRCFISNQPARLDRVNQSARAR